MHTHPMPGTQILMQAAALPVEARSARLANTVAVVAIVASFIFVLPHCCVYGSFMGVMLFPF